MKGEVAGVPACVVVGLRRLGVATVYEASGRRGLVDAPLERVVPGIRVAGLASTVLCGQGDNLAVHAALSRDATVVPVLVVVSLLAFVGSVSIARYVGGMLLRSDTGDGRDVGLPEAAEEREARR